MYYEYTCYIQLLYVPMYALTNITSLSLSLSGGGKGYADSVLSHSAWGGVLCDKKNQLVPSTNLGVGVYVCKIKVGTLY